MRKISCEDNRDRGVFGTAIVIPGRRVAYDHQVRGRRGALLVTDER
jgi:hypothetical protein